VREGGLVRGEACREETRYHVFAACRSKSLKFFCHILGICCRTYDKILTEFQFPIAEIRQCFSVKLLNCRKF
jgi:hypothetical protein